MEAQQVRDQASRIGDLLGRGHARKDVFTVAASRLQVTQTMRRRDGVLCRFIEGQTAKCQFLREKLFACAWDGERWLAVQ